MHASAEPAPRKAWWPANASSDGFFSDILVIRHKLNGPDGSVLTQMNSYVHHDYAYVH